PWSAIPGTASGKIPSAVSSAQAVQSPFGASEKIFAPHFRQTLITVIIPAACSSSLLLYCVKFWQILRPKHGDQMARCNKSFRGDQFLKARIVADLIPLGIESQQRGSHPTRT